MEGDDADLDQAEEAEEANASDDELQEVWETALTEFDAVAVPQQELRAQSLEARRFVTIPGAMWEGPWGEQNENAPRPEVDKITKSLEKIETDYRENRLDVDFVPADDVAQEETAETLDGMHRADSYHYKAMQGRDNAFQEAIRGGFGAYRLTTEYADELDPDNDQQRINPALMIADADQSVYFYGGILYDKSDAESCFVLTRELRGIAEKKWGAEACTPWPQINWKYHWDWYTPDVVCIAEYYKSEIKREKRLTLTNSATGDVQRFWNSEIEAQVLQDMLDQGWTVASRISKRKRIHKYVLNGTKVLKDCGYIPGPNIPIVPVYGRRDFVDNMERWRGHVGKKMDRQRIYNVSVAKVVETQSIAPYEVPILLAEQLAGQVTGADGALISIAEHWARGNIDRSPFRVILPVYDSEGKMVAQGPVSKIEPPQVQPATAALLQISSGDLTDDDQNVEEVKANVSADAMDIAASRVDAKSAIYLDNMRQSVQREAEIYLGMAREIYFEPGRKVDTRSIDGKMGSETLGEMSLDDGEYRIRNDLSQGSYNVVANVVESTVTKRQKTVKQCLGLAEVAGQIGDQELAQVQLLTAIANMDGEGQQDNQRYARNKLIALGVVEPSPEEQKKIEMAQQQQGQQPPSAAETALQAQAEKLSADAKLSGAKAVQTLADAHLKTAQAEAVGGPDRAPDVPTGLSAPEGIDKIASADLKLAQAAHLRHDMSLKHLTAHHEMGMAERQQAHAEQQTEAA